MRMKMEESVWFKNHSNNANKGPTAAQVGSGGA